MITVAQLVECFHVVEHSLSLIAQIVARGLEEEDIRVKVRAGRGVGAVEAPRGVLFHDYTYDDRGILTEANCIIPTNQNHNNIQKDFEALVPQILDKPQNEIRHTLEMVVRAYDPCISCSAHSLEVNFK
jgi:coenzyme F420-reducing hydrogenase alpha subunit